MARESCLIKLGLNRTGICVELYGEGEKNDESRIHGAVPTELKQLIMKSSLALIQGYFDFDDQSLRRVGPCVHRAAM
ncbi:MAG: hypothetical protein QOJ54_2449 [Aliidongia sp.]|jgi:hypothetical protein|nr:hypothetical protein [Aliidongia sp.]